jgi:hypothetical protein
MINKMRLVTVFGALTVLILLQQSSECGGQSREIKGAYLSVEMRNGYRLSGNISEVTNDTIVVRNAATNRMDIVEIKDIKRVDGYYLSKGQKVAIGIGVGIVAFIVFVHAIGGTS